MAFTLGLRCVALASVTVFGTGSPQLAFLPKDLPPDHVDCGGHWAETCAVCPQGNHWLWCHGDCTWAFGECKLTTPSVRFQSQVSEFLAATWAYLRFWGVYLSPFFLSAWLLMLLYAIVYKQQVVANFGNFIKSNPGQPYEELDNRDVGLFEVFSRPNQCMWAFFCTPVVDAKNMHVGKVTWYWETCCCMFLWYTPCCFLAACLHAGNAVSLQRNMGFRARFCGELFTSLFCMPCAVGRESIQVDRASHREVKCLFVVNDTATKDEEREIEHLSYKERFFGGVKNSGRSCASPCGDRSKDDTTSANEYWTGH